MRVRVGRYASENVVVASARPFSRELEKPIIESTVRGIKRGYLAQLNEKGVGDESVAIDRLPVKKHVEEMFTWNNFLHLAFGHEI